MKSTPRNKEKHHLLKEEVASFPSLSTRVSRTFYVTCITIAAIFSLNHIIFNCKSINHIHNLPINIFHQTQDTQLDLLAFSPTNLTSLAPKLNVSYAEAGSCDLFRGRWIRDPNASLYDHRSCKTIPSKKNCLMHGRNDTDFLEWKWKPDKCELPRFSALSFLSILRGKKMAFIGDSLARNQMESLLCLLSTVETPESKDENPDDRSRTWEFREHDFTLAVLWSPFLVEATGIPGKHGYNLQVDRVDTEWSEKLPSIDYAVFSASHWFLRGNYLYEGSQAIGCVKCRKPNTTAFGPGRAIRMAFRAALRAINDCEDCKKVVSFVRTGTPGHFENGSWKNGGRCTRTRPVEREEVDRAKPDWNYSKIQLEEVEMARIEGKGKGNEFEFLDVTEMMAMRVDGHPDRYWGSKSGSDCLHWCLPGPIDTWNGLLLENIKRLDGISRIKIEQ